MAGDRRTVLFVGVTTGASSMVPIFARWAEALDLRADLVGVDLPLDATVEQYRQVLLRMRRDPSILGAVVTSHKLGLVAAGRDLFAHLDPLATLCAEVNTVAARNGELIGYARDPVAAERTLAEMLPPDHWQRGADALCLGAGGAGTAIALSLCCDLDAADGPPRPRATGPRRFIAVDTSADRLAALQRLLEPLRGGTTTERHRHAASEENDRLLRRLPPGSLVINATGMGKDRPGSPLTDAADFPPEVVVWELNYRGPRPFLAHARSQAAARRLAVHDGWRYFLHGWTTALATILDRDLTGETFERLSQIAAEVRARAAGDGES